MKGCAILLAIPLLALDLAAQQPSFDVQTADGQTTFHIGDPIVLNLAIALSSNISSRKPESLLDAPQ